MLTYRSNGEAQASQRPRHQREASGSKGPLSDNTVRIKPPATVKPGRRALSKGIRTCPGDRITRLCPDVPTGAFVPTHSGQRLVLLPFLPAVRPG
ncbi:unnamed protein product, partial [Iphiclides podalirius]